MANRDRADIEMSHLTDDEKAKHREQIVERFQRFRRDLGDLTDNMYTSHFTEEFRESPEYITILDAVARLEQTALEKYMPKNPQA